MKNFKKLKIWQMGMEIAKHIYDLNNQLPESEKYSLKIQLWRAAISVSSNIAEGSAKSSEKDYRRFLEISLGSCFELESQIILIKSIYPKIIEECEALLDLIDQEQKMIIALIKKLN